MKVIAILESDISSGGGFNQALSGILQMKRLCEQRFDFAIFTSHSSNLPVLMRMGLKAEKFSLRFFDKLIAKLMLSSWARFLLHRYRVLGPFEKLLLKNDGDLVYFLSPSATASSLQRLNYITTVWDACHRDAPEFPEVREFAEFQLREQNFRAILGPALLTLTDSVELSTLLTRRYGVDPRRLLAMPFSPSPFLGSKAHADRSAVRDKYALPGDYYFYPAQFWPHKNHIRVLEALVLLRKQGNILNVVFAGGDKGGRAHIEHFIVNNALQDQVHCVGFVPAGDMRRLYEECLAVVMPTYFGPTNLPPLEAWQIGKPLIYSSLFIAQVGDAALCVDPDDAEELAEAMLACHDPSVRERMKLAGEIRLQELEHERRDAEAILQSRLVQFSLRRQCWP